MAATALRQQRIRSLRGTVVVLLVGVVLVAGCGEATGDAIASGSPSVEPTLPPALFDNLSPAPEAEGGAVAANLAVTVTKRTKSVRRGKNASVTIRTLPGAECGISVSSASGPSTARGLEPRQANDAGVVSWSWKVAANAKKGSVPISISCSLGDRTGEVATAVKVT